MFDERLVHCQDGLTVALGLDHHRPDFGFVQSQPQERVIELAECPQRPDIDPRP